MIADDRKLRFPEYWEQDMAAATQNLMLEAVELGLGTVWAGMAPLKERMDFERGIYENRRKYPKNL